MINFSKLYAKLATINFDFYNQNQIKDIFNHPFGLSDFGGICIYTAYVSALDVHLQDNKMKKFFKKLYKKIYNLYNPGNHEFTLTNYFNRIFKDYFGLEYDIFKLAKLSEIKNYPYIFNFGLNIPLEHSGHSILCFDYKNNYIQFRDNAEGKLEYDAKKEFTYSITKMLFLNYVVERLSRKNEDVLKLFKINISELDNINFGSVSQGLYRANILFDYPKLTNKILKVLFNENLDQFLKHNEGDLHWLNYTLVNHFVKERSFVSLTDEFIKNKLKINELINNQSFFKNLWNTFFKHTFDLNVEELSWKEYNTYSVRDYSIMFNRLYDFNNKNSNSWELKFYEVFNELFFVSNDIREEVSKLKYKNKLIIQFINKVTEGKNNLKKLENEKNWVEHSKYFDNFINELTTLMLNIAKQIGNQSIDEDDILEHVFTFDVMKEKL